MKIHDLNPLGAQVEISFKTTNLKNMSEKKIIALICLIFLFTNSEAQVGIGTIDPKATLDIIGNPTQTSQPDGLLPPRISRSQLINKTAYNINQTGTIIYVTDLSGINNSQTLNVTEVGYFYFNGSIWIKMIYDSEYGDIKQSIKSIDHNGWIKLDGRLSSLLSTTQQTRATAMGFGINLPNASNAYLVQNGSILGSVTGTNDKTIRQANLPNINFTGTANDTNTGDQWLSRVQNFGAGGAFNAVTISKTRGVSGLFSGRITNGYDDDPNEMYSTYTETAHNHKLTINSGGNDTPLNITPRSLSVNTFIYLGN